MKVEKTGRKWLVKGDGEGWIFRRKFPTKWKANVALKVFNEGGRVSDYWERARQEQPAPRFPRGATKSVEKALEEIRQIGPGCDEIEEFAKNAPHGVVTAARGENYFGPRFHDTWGEKQSGRVHIDIGCCGIHLMLDQRWAKHFIKFIKDKRKLSIEKEQNSGSS